MRLNVERYTDQKVNQIMDLLGSQLVSESKRICPVGKYKDGRVGGRLRGSISWAVGNKVKGLATEGKPPAQKRDTVSQTNQGRLRVGTAVEYGVPVEFGRQKKGIINRIFRRKNAQPFLRPPMKQASRILRQIVRQLK